MNLDEMLIEEVHTRAILYDLGQVDYKNVRKKEYAWKEVAENVKLTEVECKKRWKGLRDSYKRIKRMKQIASGSSAETPKKKWRHFEALSFLDNVASSRHTVGNIYNEDEENLTVLVDIDAADSCFSPDTESSTSKKAEKKNNSEKFNDFLDLAASSIPGTCETFAKMNEEQGSTAALFASLAKKIKEANMPPHTTNRIEAKVSNLVFNEIELFYLKTNTTT